MFVVCTTINMEFNEISMYMDVKLDIYNKRPDSLKFRTWTKCQVKIEAIKCLPCFLRINVQTMPETDPDESSKLSVSINVPGVTTSLATSRTKQYSYGLFWTHNRRNCFMYFALESEISCRKHMKWIKKSIKNLELYREVFLEQRRNSRVPGLFGVLEQKADKKEELNAVKDALSALGPLPRIPDANNSINWSRRVSRASEMYEEIYEENVALQLSRRLSHTSIASGIYEEMKPFSHNIQSIVEENFNSPPPLPPLPVHRKRVNTFESEPLATFGDIRRSNTTPESDMGNKKISRSKRSESVSEAPISTMDEIINTVESVKLKQPIYANTDIIKQSCYVKPNKRNSFSSPDLSKINFIHTFDEDKLAALLQLDSSSDLDAQLDDDFDSVEVDDVHHCSVLSLNKVTTAPRSSLTSISRIHTLKSNFGSMESLNISSQLPQNFNFSARNSSSVNLIGASGAVPSIKVLKRNEIILDDELTGYCVMAPIENKKLDIQEKTTTTSSSATSSTTSGYSTGSYFSSTSSSSSSNTLVNENKAQQKENFYNSQLTKGAAATAESYYDKLPVRKAPIPVAPSDLSNIYENMQATSPINNSNNELSGNCDHTPTLSNDFSGNLYENLLTFKAAQELEQPLPAHVCTSTPTDATVDNQLGSVSQHMQSLYQTPRKSIISVDDKVPSYYPNSCDTFKIRRRSNSPSSAETTSNTIKSSEKQKPSPISVGLKNFVNIRMKRERNENLYMSSPQTIIEQRKKSINSASSHIIDTNKSKKSANAQKIAENVYTVNLSNKKTLQTHNNNNNTEKLSYKEMTEIGQLKQKLNNELLQLALVQKIDFKFDDTSSANTSSNATTTTVSMSTDTATTATTAKLSNTLKQSGISKLEQAELEYEYCYQATKDATRLLNKYATLGKTQSMSLKPQSPHQHLQKNSRSNQETVMTQSTKLDSPTSADLTGSTGAITSKKFASLPRFKKLDLSPLKQKINYVLQRNQTPDT